jgi:hypothetical protein
VVNFLGLLKTSPGTEELESWVKTSVVRQDLFANVAMGRIRWPKSLGRPDGSQLLQGFVFHARFWVDIWHIDAAGEIVTDLLGWSPASGPSVWDGPEEPDHFSVKYLHYASPHNDNQIEVRLSNVHWQRPGRFLPHLAHRYLSSSGWQFCSDGQFTALPDITVDDKRFFHP